ncbi:hypothetical protein MBORA_09240 [Methanobrevibacter oralis]|uniref:Uncharacterized protein n=1 Tax=Methanobrevibacter oralis TaxID=66851 RepID=A0A166B8T9_METOA|nr:hypothetical protein [Methanobrevibacter oralis]KZX13023.1 hypothetical protein MBORA_09240 [Methanobrevibacter oralis]
MNNQNLAIFLILLICITGVLIGISESQDDVNSTQKSANLNISEDNSSNNNQSSNILINVSLECK